MAGKRVLVVQAPYYLEIAKGLLAGASAVLDREEITFDCENVTGAFEIPAAISMAKDNYEGFIALGCVIRGETHHFHIVADQSARALMDLTVNHRLALGLGILTVENQAQALVRADPTQKNHGGAAAEACVAMMAFKSKFAGMP